MLSDTEKTELWEKILAEHLDNGRAHYEAGMIFIQMQELDRAAECADRVIELDPTYSRILLNLGTMLGMDERWEEAESAFNRFLEYDSVPALEAFAIAKLATVKKHTGEQQQADELLKRAKAIDPDVWITVMPPAEEIFTPL
jgi:tetratricopeptide (TPR) repeat protein